MPGREARPALSRADRQHPAVVVQTPATGPARVAPVPMADGRVQIKFRAGRDLRRRLRLAAATMERTQDEILAEALEAWLVRHDAGG